MGRERSPAVIIRELLDRRIVSLEDAVGSGLLGVDCSVSHHAARLQIGDGERLFVKRADPVGSFGRDLTTEAAVYRLAQSNPSLSAVVPGCRFVTEDDSLIVMDDVGGEHFPTAAMFAAALPSSNLAGADSLLGAYGLVVATVHQVHPPAFGQPPWLLVALEPRWGRYDWLSRPCSELLMRLAERPALRLGFGAAASEWRAKCLVHGDLRWSNVLVASGTGSSRVLLVDWELACLGDPAWDVGSVIADLIARANLDRVGQQADPLFAASTFLGSYRQRTPSSISEWIALVQLGVAMAGVRLVQTLVEYAHAGEGHLANAEPILLPWIEALLSEAPTIGAELARSVL